MPMDSAALALEQRVAIPSDAQLVPGISPSLNTVTAAAAAHAASKV